MVLITPRSRRGGFARQRQGHAAALAIAMCLLSETGAAHAQQVRRGASALDLPRKGYEPRNLRIGSTVVALEARSSFTYDSNIFAASRNEVDDFIIGFSPRIDTYSDFNKLKLHSEIYADVREHIEIGQESAASFGSALAADYSISRIHSIRTEAGYDRAIESRADPEASGGIFAPPRKIDILFSDLAYGYRGSRIGLDATAAVQRFNFLAANEDDRDMEIYRGSVRGSLRVAAPIDVFVEAYVNRRNFDDPVDRSGINRDATSIGVLAGVRREISGRWRGRLGVGLFQSEPDDPALKPFSGLAASGELTWTPQPRTAVTLQVFRGDVATVRVGATGRTDTRASLRIDQEARHNLLLRGTLSYLQSDFRGTAGREQTTAAVDLEAEYLLNRHLSLVATANYTRRSARPDVDDFNRGAVGVAIRLRY